MKHKHTPSPSEALAAVKSSPRAPRAGHMSWGKYIKPHLIYFILGPLCMIVEVIGEVLMPLIQGYIIFGVGGNTEEMPGWLAWLYNALGTQSSFIVAMAVGLILTALLMMVGGVGGAYFGAKASVNFAADLRADIYKKVQNFSFANIDKFQTGSLVTRLTNDVTQLQNFVNSLLRMALRAPGMLIGALIMAIAISRRLAAVLAIVLPIMLVLMVILIRISMSRYRTMQERVDGLNNNVQESITNIRVVKSFVREQHESDKFAATNAALKQGTRRAMMISILMSPCMTLIMNSTTLAVLYFGGQMVLDGDMAIAELSPFITYITQILSSLMMVTMLFMQVSRAMASAKRIGEVMNEEADISDLTAAQPDRPVTRGDIVFRHVSFRYYKNSEGKVLDDINLSIPAGSTVGIIGSTGSGKSTLVSMIPRLYDPDEGGVYIDGINVRDYSLHNLREGVGMVLQKNVLFSGTVGDNLRWGDACADDVTVRTAAQSAQADGFITAMPQGYDSVLEQGGANVSGGQKQRLCIARALLKKPKILILDDSTSAVDTATEARIREAFRGALKDSTKIIIAQRITSVMDADIIVVLNDGRITGMGTHEQLLADNVEYREICESQNESLQNARDVQAAERAVASKEVMA